MGPVELSVADLERSLDYWRETVGLRVIARENGTASLGTDAELVALVEEPGAQPDYGHTAKPFRLQFFRTLDVQRPFARNAAGFD